MKSEYKKYILDNMNSKSPKEIARDLGIKERKVKKFISTIGPDQKEPHVPADAPPRMDRWYLTAASVAIIFIIAFLVRWIYIDQLSQTYFFGPFKGGFDDYMFDRWALSILGGDHLWDNQLFIYRLPLYAYFLSAVYFLFGHSYYSVYIIQSIISGLICIQVYFMGRSFFDKNSALVASLAVALCGTLLYYSGMLVGAVLASFLNMSALMLLIVFQRREGNLRLLLAGSLIGLSMLLRGNVIFFLPFLVFWLYKFFCRNNIRLFLKYVAILILGVALAVAPVTIRNYVVKKDFVPISAHGGLALYLGNAYGANGRFWAPPEIGANLESMIGNSVKIAEKSQGRELKPSEVSSYWLKRTILSIRDNGPGYWVALIGKKVVLLLSSYEAPDIWDYYFVREHVRILKYPLVSFAFLLAFAVLGMYMSRRRWRELFLLYGFLGSYAASLIIFLITSRYRVQLISPLSLFAGYGVISMVAVLRKDIYKAILPIIIVCGVLLFSNISQERALFATSYNSLGIILKHGGNIDEAIEQYEKAIEIMPYYPSPYYNLGLIYMDRSDYSKAAFYMNKTLSINPNFIEAKEQLDIINSLTSGIYQQ